MWNKIITLFFIFGVKTHPVSLASGNIQCVVWEQGVSTHICGAPPSQIWLHQHPVHPAASTEPNRLIVFAMTAVIPRCSFEYVKHSVCQSLMEIQSDHLVGVVEGKAMHFELRLSALRVWPVVSQDLTLLCHSLSLSSPKSNFVCEPCNHIEICSLLW